MFKDPEQVVSHFINSTIDPSPSKLSTRRARAADISLTYEETTGKRGVTEAVESCRRQIDEQNYQRRSQSPYRGPDDFTQAQAEENGYSSVSVVHNAMSGSKKL